MECGTTISLETLIAAVQRVHGQQCNAVAATDVTYASDEACDPHGLLLDALAQCINDDSRLRTAFKYVTPEGDLGTVTLPLMECDPAIGFEDAVWRCLAIAADGEHAIGYGIINSEGECSVDCDDDTPIMTKIAASMVKRGGIPAFLVRNATNTDRYACDNVVGGETLAHRCLQRIEQNGHVFYCWIITSEG